MKNTPKKGKLWRLMKVLYFLISIPILGLLGIIIYFDAEIYRGVTTVINYFGFLGWIIILILSYIIISDILQRIWNYISYEKFDGFLKTTKQNIKIFFVIIICVIFLFIGSKNFDNFCKKKGEIINSNGTCECNIGFNKDSHGTCKITLEGKIIKELPSGSFLREFKNIPGEKDTFLGIYITDYKINPITQENPPYTDCFGEVEGNSIEGNYHIFTFENDRITSDLLVPGLLGNNSSKFAFPYKNTKINNFQYFGGKKPENESNYYELENTNLVNFKDYTGDGLNNEFLLINHWDQVCGHNNYAVGGFSKDTRKVIFYEIKNKDGSSSFWWDNFVPDNKGNATTGWECGDHGSGIETKSTFVFDKNQNIYSLTATSSKECPEGTF